MKVYTVEYLIRIKIIAFVILMFNSLILNASKESYTLYRPEASVRDSLEDVKLLKVELARYSGQVGLVESMLSKISEDKLSKQGQIRYKSLLNYVIGHSGVQPDNFSANFNVNLSNTVILLPLTGRYANIGQKILKGIKHKLKGNIKVIDSNKITNPEKLWTEVISYQPSFVIGPVKPKLVSDIVSLNTSIPMLTFNHPQIKKSFVRTIAPKTSDRVTALLNFLRFKGRSRWVAIESKTLPARLRGTTLMSEFRKKSNKQSKISVVAYQKIKKSLDKTLEKVLNAKCSKSRISWLQYIVKQPLQAEVRTRSDIEGIVLFGNMNEAMQVKPLLEYYKLKKSIFVWMPTISPSLSKLKRSISTWKETFVLLPEYFPVEQLKKEKTKKDIVFYALGRLSVFILNDMEKENFNGDTKSSSFLLNSAIGQISVNSERRIHLFPHLVSINKGRIKVFEVPR